MSLSSEIKRRRTFAIVSHPDAGKTTLTEKLLLFGGAIHVAGAVKSNKIKRGATSDFMEIERQRGISVSTSVMGFEYEGAKINILDTPGHQDFVEDTFRTLTAVDSVIVVIDAAKGVEIQTLRLMQVCRMRKTPVIVFINKLDRESQDPFDLLDEIEKKLEIATIPLSWPIESGMRFKGVYNLYNNSLNLFAGTDKQRVNEPENIDYNSPKMVTHIGQKNTLQLKEDIEVINEIYTDFNRDDYLAGMVSPVFFGSALFNFGVKELLDTFIKIAPHPQPVQAVERIVDPFEEKFTGFVFKIHANMDPNHRDRIAFVKICSGVFQRNTNYLHVKLNKKLKFSNPTSFMASKKEVVDDAYPGDIIGLYDSGNFKIGDTLSSGEMIHFKGLPSFSPELFRFIENADPLKSKQLAKGIDQLMDEGVAQLFTSTFNGRKIVGTVGALQLEVIEYRLLNEYGAQCRWEPVQFFKAVWFTSENIEQLTDFKNRKVRQLAFDKHGRNVFLPDSSYELDMAREKFSDIQFHFTSEF
ncbi:MAG: peptide chain release factor 3 [Salinivirgaceae bacterium]|nr:peptide chain release factor 3 [Salinivirgaceae bacterium]